MKYGDAFTPEECAAFVPDDSPTPRQVIGEGSARVIEAKARADADAKEFAFKPRIAGDSWVVQWIASMEQIIYCRQYQSRLMRNERKAEAGLLKKSPQQKEALANLLGEA